MNSMMNPVFRAMDLSLLHAASLLLPADRREEWLSEGYELLYLLSLLIYNPYHRLTPLVGESNYNSESSFGLATLSWSC